MSHIEISHRVHAPVHDVWAQLADLKSHAGWMKDAVAIEFLSATTSGAGTRFSVPTRVGPFRTTDILEVVGWQEGESIDVRHRGLVSGTGSFRLHPDEAGTIVEWTENLLFPWWLGGKLTAWLARPVLIRIWRGNLERFAGIVENVIT